MLATRIGAVLVASLWIGGAISVLAALALAMRPGPHARHRVATTALTAFTLGVAGMALWGETVAAAWMAWLAPLWLIGTAVALIRLGNSLRRVARLRASARPAGRSWQQRMDECAGRLGITRPVAMLVSDERDAPCTVGVRSPAIIFPAALLSRLSAPHWDALATHELAHVRRHDYLWHLLHSLTAAVFFYHPAVRWLADVIARAREASCDRDAAAACGSLAVADSLAAAERLREGRRRSGTARQLVPRIETLVDEPRVRFSGAGSVRTLLAATLAGLAAAVVAWPVEAGSSPTSWLPLAAATGLGLAIGLRHALEPDHLMAVATLVARERGLGAAVRLGASWGVGHTLALLALGSVLIAARLAVPAGLDTLFELAVVTMIFVMGLRALVDAWRLNRDGRVALHRHGDVRHVHATAGAHLHIGGVALATRPLLVGLVHGLAGSGALTAMAIAGLPSWPEQLAFMLLFGLGSALGMAAVTGAAGWPLARLARTRGALPGLSAATGLAAIVFSVAWSAPLLLQPFGR